MRFALFQPSLTPLPEEAIARVLARIPRLAAREPAQVAAHAHGVLLDGLTREEAEAALAALEETHAPDGPVQIGDRAWLQPLARTVTRRLRLEPDALVILDAYGATTRVAWHDVLLLAAAELPVDDGTPAPPTARARTRTRTEDLVSAVLAPDQPATRSRAVIDLVVKSPVRSYRIEADSFDYACLGERKQPSTAHNFRALTLAIATRAVAALHNPGATELLSHGRVLRYADAARFDRETGYFVWKIHEGDATRCVRAPGPAAPALPLDPALLLGSPKQRLIGAQHSPKIARTLLSLLALVAITWLLHLLGRMASSTLEPLP